MKFSFGKKSKNKRAKTPTVLQMEATECGAASLCMILAYYDLWVPLEKMRQECGVNRDGVSARNILLAARQRGCKAVSYRWPYNMLFKAKFPLLIHWEFNHFVVLEGVDENNAYLNDPAAGHRMVPMDEFKSSYTGIALDIRPGDNFQKGGSGYNIIAKITEKLLRDKTSLAYVLLVCAFLVIPGLTAPVFGQIFLDDILTGKHTDWIYNLLGAMVVALLIKAVLTFLRTWCLTKWQTKLTLADSSKFFWHVLKLPMDFFNQRFGAEVASRVAFNESIAAVLTGSAATALLDLLVAVFYLALLFQYNASLTFIGIFFSLINVGVFFMIRAKLLEMSMKVQQDTGKEQGAAMNGLMMIETLKANGNESEFFAKWAGYHTKVVAGQQRITMYNLTMQMLPVLLAGLNSALIMTVGGFNIMDGLMTTGIFVAFQSLMGNFQEPFNKLMTLADSLQTTEMQMKRLEDVMLYEKDDLNYPDEEPPSIGKSRLYGELELNDIRFGYSLLRAPLFDGFNLKLEPGHWVALVGGSGSGKSTVAKIVTGIYKQWDGEVLFDGLPRTRIPREVLCNSIASVDQDIFLFSGTVEENITLFDNSVRHSDVVRAARDACIHDDILSLHGGYDAKVGEGGFNFSGGQRQRLEIARALAFNPSILVLDEATSALDPLTEQKVMDNIRRRGCTCIIVAHRLSTIRDCDEIVVIDNGVICERGTHSLLMEQNGVYARLINDNGALSAKEGGEA